jgi:hypothetical protein
MFHLVIFFSTMRRLGETEIIYVWSVCFILTELSPSWGAINWASTQDLPSTSWNPKVQYRIHNSPPLVPILSPINSMHTIPSYLSEIHFDIVHPPTIVVNFLDYKISHFSVLVSRSGSSFLLCLWFSFLWRAVWEKLDGTGWNLAVIYVYLWCYLHLAALCMYVREVGHNPVLAPRPSLIYFASPLIITLLIPHFEFSGSKCLDPAHVNVMMFRRQLSWGGSYKGNGNYTLNVFAILHRLRKVWAHCVITLTRG